MGILFQNISNMKMQELMRMMRRVTMTMMRMEVVEVEVMMNKLSSLPTANVGNVVEVSSLHLFFCSFFILLFLAHDSPNESPDAWYEHLYFSLYIDMSSHIVILCT